MRKLITILIIAFIIIGCECVPDLNTNKITEPVNNAKLMIYNGISDLAAINIYSDEFLLYENLTPNNSSIDYLKFPVNSSGYLSVWNGDNSFRLINMPLNLEKDNYYTLILAGTSDEPGFILLKDFENTETDSGYLRIVNITAENILIISPKGVDTLSFLLKKMQYSQNLAFKDEKTNLELFLKEELLFRYEETINRGELNTMIISNYYSEPYYFLMKKQNPF